MCWASDRFGTAAKAAASLNKATVKYILARSRGEKPGIPDVLWQGDDCWLVHNTDCQQFGELVRQHVIVHNN